MAARTIEHRLPAEDAIEAWDLCFQDGHCAGVHRSLFEGAAVWDAHAHLGRDRDGHALDAESLLAEMHRFGAAKSVVFPLDDPGPGRDFRAANTAVLGAARRHPDRLIPFFRLDPWSDWAEEYDRCLGAGFRGIKLHPRAQLFGADAEIAEPIFARAASDSLTVLVHTGLGVDRPARRLAAVARRHPSLRLIAGHACFAELESAIRILGPCTNVWLETSGVAAYDLVPFLKSVGPSRLLLGSDAPYGSLAAALQALVGAAVALGVPREVVRPALGDNLARLLGES